MPLLVLTGRVAARKCFFERMKPRYATTGRFDYAIRQDRSPSMKYAFVDGQRQEARRVRSGVCPACDGAMVPRCGRSGYTIGHTAREVCATTGGSPETEWHRCWKNRFPLGWQEIVHPAENGDNHIADVTTDQGWVLEFQHSPIRPDERESREAFYKNLVWIVDATRRKRDKSQFLRACEAADWSSRRSVWRASRFRTSARYYGIGPVVVPLCSLISADSMSRWTCHFGGCFVSSVEWRTAGRCPGRTWSSTIARMRRRTGLDFSALLGKINEIVDIVTTPRHDPFSTRVRCCCDRRSYGTKGDGGGSGHAYRQTSARDPSAARLAGVLPGVVSASKPLLVGTVSRPNRQNDPRSVQLLQAVAEHGTVVLLENPFAYVHRVVRADAQDVGVVGGVVDLAQRETVLNDRDAPTSASGMMWAASRNWVCPNRHTVHLQP